MTQNDEIVPFSVEPIILELFLFKNEYKDRLLISEIKKRIKIIPSNISSEKNTFFVPVKELKKILNTKFNKDIVDFRNTPETALEKSISSVFFIDSLLTGFSELKFIKIHVSEVNRSSRHSDDSIIFDYKIMHTKVDLPAVCEPDFLVECRNLLIELGLYKPGPFNKIPYIEVNALAFLSLLESREIELNALIESGEYEDENIEKNVKVVSIFKTIFGTKVKEDNSVILIVVEP